MSANSKIEWTDATWNPIRGCSRVSEGCRNCYAEKIAARFSGPGQAFEKLAKPAGWTGAIEFVESKLEEPLHWKKPRRIFVNSMSDLFHDGVLDRWLDQIFAIMALCPQHTFQILTKRPKRARKYLDKNGHHRILGKAWEILGRYRNRKYEHHGITNRKFPLSNVWLGVSVEDQATADERIPLLLQTPAAIRWGSYEPALGPVDFLRYEHLDWIVMGGESGSGAREMRAGWVRWVRNQCAESATPFFFKQWGEWAPNPGAEYIMSRVGKKKAGRLLDGREHNDFPVVEI